MGPGEGASRRPLCAPPPAAPGGPAHTDGSPGAAARRARGGHNQPSVRCPQVGQEAGHTCAAQMVPPAAAGTEDPLGTRRRDESRGMGGVEGVGVGSFPPSPPGDSFQSLESGEGATEKIALGCGTKPSPRPSLHHAMPCAPGPEASPAPLAAKVSESLLVT
ncbi:unnamed protein product [Rangifer tarandus platyrhynchus]|uniref:Uncharacterized protein n=2 Tax=Rangifer tarandus platyrhynchus TaxID=3082113 RepID=A0ACB0FHY1_RANTA|nr:unnamed protein product [Rangifer tarandus platyrhynchus]CAI9712730.1 unnamed protein product [Rangifer tarandus platyrhynchus]